MRFARTSYLLASACMVASDLLAGTSAGPLATADKFTKVINAEAMGWYLYKPFVALYTEDDETHCSGVVIGDHAILTAAHCLEVNAPLVARFNDDKPDMKLKSSMYHIDPDYFLNETHYNFNHDVGVIITKKKIPKSAGRALIIDREMVPGETVYAFGVGDIVEDETDWEKLMDTKSTKSFGDFIDWIGDAVGDVVDTVGDAVNDAVDWVDDVVFGDDDYYIDSYDTPYEYETYEEVENPYDEIEYVYDPYEYYEYEDFLVDGNEFVASAVPRMAVMRYERDTSCALFDGVYEDGMMCTVSETQNTCNGDSGGPVVTPEGYLVGLTSLGSPGCDQHPFGNQYESAAVDLNFSDIKKFIKTVAGGDAYVSNDPDPVDLGTSGGDDESAGPEPDSESEVPSPVSGSQTFAWAGYAIAAGLLVVGH
jgi:hypothetical protein